jgi:hypothetical protein
MPAKKTPEEKDLHETKLAVRQEHHDKLQAVHDAVNGHAGLIIDRLLKHKDKVGESKLGKEVDQIIEMVQNLNPITSMAITAAKSAINELVPNRSDLSL